MPTTDSTQTIFRVLAVACLATLTGCASVQSIDFPWENKSASEAGVSSAEANETEASESDSTADDDSDSAFYWARRAVSASRRVAYGAGVEEAVRSTPDALASSESDVSAPYGRWEQDGTAEGAPGAPGRASGRQVEEVAASPKKRSIDRDAAGSATEDPASNGASAGDTNDSGSEASADGTETTSDSTPRSFEPREATNHPGSHGWPVGFPDGELSDRGARTVVDPSVEADIYHLDNSEERSKVVDQWGLNPPSSDGAIAIPGTYVQNIRQYDDYDDLDPEQLDRQIAVVVPGDAVTIYAGERKVTSMELPGSGELPDQLAEVRPVRAVQDDTMQLLVFWEESSKDDDTLRYRVGLLKAIGPFVGTIFERTVATRTGPDAELRRAGYLEFLRGAEHRFIQWTPATEDGEPDPDGAKVLEWNEWEGVYRVPKPPPTAPDQRS